MNINSGIKALYRRAASIKSERGDNDGKRGRPGGTTQVVEPDDELRKAITAFCRKLEQDNTDMVAYLHKNESPRMVLYSDLDKVISLIEQLKERLGGVRAFRKAA